MFTDALLILVRGFLVLTRSGGPRLPDLPPDGRRVAGAAVPACRPASPAFMLPGTRPLLRRDRGFVTRFALDPAQVAHVQVYADPGGLDGFPVPLRECLQRMAEEGRCRGPEVAGLVFSGRTLAIGEQLYFATVRASTGDPELVAFVDRVRL